jgi:hypothetical protein
MKPSAKVVDDMSYLSTDAGVRDKQSRRHYTYVNAPYQRLYIYC